MVVVQLEEYTTLNNQQELVDRIVAELQRGSREFVLDLARTVYLDAAALSTLVGLARQVREQGGDLRLVNPNGDIRLLLESVKPSALKIPQGESSATGPDSAPGAACRGKCG
jgi:anti-anti-sigma factor